MFSVALSLNPATTVTIPSPFSVKSEFVVWLSKDGGRERCSYIATNEHKTKIMQNHNFNTAILDFGVLKYEVTYSLVQSL